ncbi:hypothetical protein BGX27_004383, partial [Mortierella sp. AM989]
MATKLTLYCLVEGQSTRNAFYIEIEPTKTVADLRKDIHSAKPVVFNRVDENDLTLWRVSLPDDDEKSTIALHALDKKEILHPRHQLSKLIPLLLDDNMYIIVQPPMQAIEPIPDLVSTLNLSDPLRAHHSLALQNKDIQQIKDMLLEAKDKDEKMLILQQEVISLQNQALDRLAILQKYAQAILVQNFELHEYPIPRLFIILPEDCTKWNPKNVLENKFRLHFLCECGDHTMKASKSSQHHIHIAKHEGYEIRNSTDFFSKYGKYMLILMQCLKLGELSAITSIPRLVDAGIDYSIDYMKALSIENSILSSINTIGDYEGLEGADLRQLDTFLRINDSDRKLGN